MANFLFPSAKELMLTGQFNWTTDNIRVVLLAEDMYTPSINHTTLLDVPAAARVAVSDVLTGKTVAINVVDADDYLFSSVSGPVVSAALLVSYGTTDAASYLIAHLDDCIAGLPLTPTTGPVQLTWNNGESRIFAL